MASVVWIISSIWSRSSHITIHTEPVQARQAKEHKNLSRYVETLREI